jgi:hypothetical protein
VSSIEMVYLLKTSRDLQMPFAAVTHLVEGLSFEALLALKVKNSIIIIIQFNSVLYLFT